MRTAKMKIPGAVIVLFVILGALLCVLFNAFSTLYIYHFPSTSLSAYPDTQWKCDKLGVELFVDEDGNISGSYKNGSEQIALDVTNRIPTTSKHLECYADDKLLFFYCFYANVDNGVFYVIVNSSDTTLDIDAVPDHVPYRFVKQAG